MARTCLVAVVISLMLCIGCGKKETSSRTAKKRTKVKLDAESKAGVREAIDKFRQAMKDGKIDEAKKYVTKDKLDSWGSTFESKAKELSERDMMNVAFRRKGPDRVELCQEQKINMGSGMIASTYTSLNIVFVKEDGQWKWGK